MISLFYLCVLLQDFTVHLFVEKYWLACQIHIYFKMIMSHFLLTARVFNLAKPCVVTNTLAWCLTFVFNLFLLEEISFVQIKLHVSLKLVKTLIFQFCITCKTNTRHFKLTVRKPAKVKWKKKIQYSIGNYK